jgi:hypothetical protein
VVLPFLALVILGAHYYRVVRRHGLSLPAWVEEGDLSPEEKEAATTRVRFLPDLLSQAALLTCLGLLALAALSVYLFDAPLVRHANPQHTPVNAEAPWFFLWVQGLLKLGDRTVMGIVIPLLFIGLLFVLPYLERSKHRRLRKRPIAALFSMFAVAALAILTYMGTPEYGLNLPPAVEISHTLAPEEGPGPLHQIPFDDLEVGAFAVNATALDTLPESLAEVFNSYERQVSAFAADGTFQNVDAWMVVEDWQQDLKRVTLRITWMDPDTEERRTYRRYIYLHRERDGGESEA